MFSINNTLLKRTNQKKQVTIIKRNILDFFYFVGVVQITKIQFKAAHVSKLPF